MKNESKNATNSNATLSIDTTLTEVVINFESLKRKESIKLSELPIATIDYMLQGATRKFNDWLNTEYAAAKKDAEAKGESIDEKATRESLVAECLERIHKGDFTPKVRNTETTQFKRFVLQYLKDSGISAKDLKPLNGATVEAIIKSVLPTKTPEEINEVIAKLRSVFDAQQALVKNAGFKLV